MGIYNYILENPLYLHSTKNSFLESARAIESPMLKKEFLQNKMKEYINILAAQEKNIIIAVGGQENLDIILRDITYWNENLREITEIINEIFPTGETDEVNRHLITQGKNKSGKKASFFNVNNVGIEMIKSENGEIDWDKSISEAKVNKTYDNFKKAFDKYINYMSERSKAVNDYEKQLKKLLDEEVITSKTGKTPIDTLKKYLDNFNIDKNKTISGEYLDDLRRCSNVYSYLKGAFDEGVEIKFTLNAKTLIEEEMYKRIRGDQLTVQNRKPDLIIYNGKALTIENNPLTISKKVAAMSKSSKSGNATIHFQDSELMSNTNAGLYKFLNDEEKGLGNYYVYLNLNYAFYKDYEVEEIINNINQYLSYPFISGSLYDVEKDRAVFLIVTKTSGKEVKGIKIVSIKDLLLDIFKNNTINIGQPKLKNPEIKETLELLNMEKRKALNKKPFDYRTIINSSEFNEFMRDKTKNKAIGKVVNNGRSVSMVYNNVKAEEYQLLQELKKENVL